MKLVQLTNEGDKPVVVNANTMLMLRRLSRVRIELASRLILALNRALLNDRNYTM